MNQAVEAAIKVLESYDYVVLPKDRRLTLSISSLVDKFEQSVLPFEKVLEIIRHQHAQKLAVEIMQRPDLTLEIRLDRDQRVQMITKLGFIKPALKQAV